LHETPFHSSKEFSSLNLTNEFHKKERRKSPCKFKFKFPLLKGILIFKRSSAKGVGRETSYRFHSSKEFSFLNFSKEKNIFFIFKCFHSSKEFSFLNQSRKMTQEKDIFMIVSTPQRNSHF